MTQDPQDPPRLDVIRKAAGGDGYDVVEKGAGDTAELLLLKPVEEAILADVWADVIVVDETTTLTIRGALEDLGRLRLRRLERFLGLGGDERLEDRESMVDGIRGRVLELLDEVVDHAGSYPAGEVLPTAPIRDLAEAFTRLGAPAALGPPAIVNNFAESPGHGKRLLEGDEAVELATRIIRVLPGLERAFDVADQVADAMRQELGR